MVYRFVINSVVMWLHILVRPCWCVHVALFGSRRSNSEQCNMHCVTAPKYVGAILM